MIIDVGKSENFIEANLARVIKKSTWFSSLPCIHITVPIINMVQNMISTLAYGDARLERGNQYLRSEGNNTKDHDA